MKIYSIYKKDLFLQNYWAGILSVSRWCLGHFTDPVTGWLSLNFSPGAVMSLADPHTFCPVALDFTQVFVLHSPRLDPIRLSYTWNLNSQDSDWRRPLSHPSVFRLRTDSRRGWWTVGALSRTVCVYCVRRQGSLCTCECTGEVCISALTVESTDVLSVVASVDMCAARLEAWLHLKSDFAKTIIIFL